MNCFPGYCYQPDGHGGLCDDQKARAALLAKAAIDSPPESLVDDLMGDVMGCLAMFREPHCGGYAISDDDLKARAANLVSGIIGNYKVTPR